MNFNKTITVQLDLAIHMGYVPEIKSANVRVHECWGNVKKNFMVSAHGRAITQNQSGHNITNETVRKMGNTNSRAEGKSSRRQTNNGCR